MLVAMIKHHRKNIGRQSGFTLIEIALALVISGIFTAGALFLFDVASRQRDFDLTEHNMRLVIDSLATYAESSGRLPCPADPWDDPLHPELFGWEWGVQTAPGGGVQRPHPVFAGSVTCNTWGVPASSGTATPHNMGIVPFQTLGLDPDTVRDAWGNYFTYAASPAFTQLNDRVEDRLTGGVGTDDQGNVHVRCLNQAWLTPDGLAANEWDNISANKALFCCVRDSAFGVTPNPANDIILQSQDGSPVWPVPGGELYNAGRNITLFDSVELDPLTAAADAPYVVLPRTGPPQQQAHFIESPAFVLISHGRNGEGAYLGNGTRNRYLTGAATANEIENGAGNAAVSYDQVFITDDGAQDSFDDIVIWRTQNGIMAETGASSCAYP